MTRLETIADVRAWARARREELIADRKRYRADGDTMQAYEVTGIALELGDLLTMLPESDAA